MVWRGACYPAFFGLLVAAGSWSEAPPDVRAELVRMNGRLDSIARAMDSLRSSVSDLTFKQFLSEPDSIAYLTPSDRGYSVIQTSLGAITVNLADVQPYANGSRVSIKFGNTTSATIDDAKATVDWGRVDAKGTPDNAHQASEEIVFEKSLAAGSWTTVRVVLAAVPPSDLGFVRIHGLAHKGIRLIRR